MNAPISVDIISDIVCPWCWLGWRYLKQAIDETETPVKVTWRAYMLDSTVPKDGVDYKSYMRSKFGNAPDNKFKIMRSHLEAKGPELGIDFRFDGIPKRANTLASHQLMLWAQGQDKANDMAEALFQAFFTDHRDINQQEVLLDIAKNVGMDADIIAGLYERQADEANVMAEINAVSRAGIQSVPSYIYQGKYLVQGAQGKEAHAQVIEKLAAEALKLSQETSKEPS